MSINNKVVISVQQDDSNVDKLLKQQSNVIYFFIYRSNIFILHLLAEN